MSRRKGFGINRRSFLKGSAAAGLAAAGVRLAWRPNRSFASPPPTGTDVLVCLFVRGGLDGLSAVIPYQEAKYYDRRPTIAIPANQVLDLDGQFGLHPGLAPLLDTYTNGDLAVLHAVGHASQTRSHFDAQDWLERGAFLGDGMGWLARHLDICATGTASPLRGVSVDTALPFALRGTTDSVSIVDPTRFSLIGWPAGSASQLGATLDLVYATADTSGLRVDLAERAAQTRQVMDLIASVSLAPPMVTYPDTELGLRFEFIASLIRARNVLPIEVLCADLPRHSADLHASMGTWDTGAFRNLATTLADAVHAFYLDMSLDNLLNDVTLVIVSEFGRQVHENVGLGTDHGKGGCMFVMGGGVNAGVYTSWPGLDDAALDPPMALAVTTDFRNVLGEVLEKRLGNPNTTQVFPGLSYQPLGLLQPRV